MYLCVALMFSFKLFVFDFNRAFVESNNLIPEKPNLIIPYFNNRWLIAERGALDGRLGEYG